MAKKLPKFDDYLTVTSNWGDGYAILRKDLIIGINSNDDASYTIYLEGSEPVRIWDHNPDDAIAAIISELDWT